MIPNNKFYDRETGEEMSPDFKVESMPSLTYAMNLEKNRFVGKVDGEAAIRQAIVKIIHTERYEHEIYSWDYGMERKDLYGKSIPYVLSEVKRRITEALTSDDRIAAIEDFTVERVGKDSLHLNFTVITLEDGQWRMEREVPM